MLEKLEHQLGMYYSPTLGTTFSMDLSLFFSLILSYHFRLQTVRRFSMRTHLPHALHIFTTYVCLMANLMPLNLTLFLTVHFHAMHGYTATYMHTPHVYASLPFCHHYAVAPCSFILICLSQTVSIDLVQACTYHMIVYKSQGINWHPQSDSLGVLPLKQTQ